jgi:hypothetical protein
MLIKRAFDPGTPLLDMSPDRHSATISEGDWVVREGDQEYFYVIQYLLRIENTYGRAETNELPNYIDLTVPDETGEIPVEQPSPSPDPVLPPLPPVPTDPPVNEIRAQNDMYSVQPGVAFTAGVLNNDDRTGYTRVVSCENIVGNGTCVISADEQKIIYTAEPDDEGTVAVVRYRIDDTSGNPITQPTADVEFDVAYQPMKLLLSGVLAGDVATAVAAGWLHGFTIFNTPGNTVAPFLTEIAAVGREGRVNLSDDWFDGANALSAFGLSEAAAINADSSNLIGIAYASEVGISDPDYAVRMNNLVAAIDRDELVGAYFQNPTSRDHFSRLWYPFQDPSGVAALGQLKRREHDGSLFPLDDFVGHVPQKTTSRLPVAGIKTGHCFIEAYGEPHGNPAFTFNPVGPAAAYSGSTDEIYGVENTSPDRFWFRAGRGHIWHQLWDLHRLNLIQCSIYTYRQAWASGTMDTFNPDLWADLKLACAAYVAGPAAVVNNWDASYRARNPDLVVAAS